jgi:hypothetical protein
LKLTSLNSQLLQFLLSAALGGGVGYLIGMTKLLPAVQDILAGIGGVGAAGAVLLGRVIVFMATARGRWGTFVGLDPPSLRTLGALVGAAVLLCGVVHVLFTRVPALGVPAFRGARSALVGLVAGALVAWLLAAGYWEGT